MNPEVFAQNENRVILDFADENSFPSAIKDVVRKCFYSLPQEVVRNIIKSTVEDNSSISVAIEKNVPQDIIEELCHEIIPIIDKCYFLVYHITKVINLDDLRERGLQNNKLDRYIARLSSDLRWVGASNDDIDAAMELIKKRYEKKYENRMAQLCFFPNFQSLVQEKSTYDIIELFCENVGGELARQALSEKMPNIYKLLADNGKRVAVKVLLPREDFFYSTECIAKQIIYYYANKLWGKREYFINFDCSTPNDLPPSLIIDVVDFPRWLGE